MRMKGFVFARAGAFLAAVLAIAPAEAVIFPAGTHTFVLTIKNDYGAIASSADDYSVEISTITTPSVVLTGGPVGDFDANGVNCVLYVPMTTAGGGGAVKTGEIVKLALYKSSTGTKLGSQDLTIGDADDVSRYSLQMTDLLSYTEGGRTLSVPKAYVEAWQPDFKEYFQEAYSPFRDSDGDGFSNYDEFVAGTDPTDKNSCLKIVSFVLENGDSLIGFPSVPDQAYMLQGADSPGADANWRDIPFRLTPDGIEMWSFAYPGADTPSDGLTVFRALMSTDKAKFYRIKTK